MAGCDVAEASKDGQVEQVRVRRSEGYRDPANAQAVSQEKAAGEAPEA
jgi:hypothetical protein